MPAPLVIPLAENMSTFTTFAEKANQVSENIWKLEVNKLELQENESLAKMTKEMNELKHKLSQIKPTNMRAKHSKNRQRGVSQDNDRNSPASSTDRCSSSSSDENCETRDSKKHGKSVSSKAERIEHERINNLQRRYSCKLGSRENINVSKTITRGNNRIR